MAFSDEEIQQIYSLVNARIDDVERYILQLDKQNLKYTIIDLENYGLKEFDFNTNRYFVLNNCTLVKDIKEAFFNKQFIVLKFFGNFWTLNSFQDFHQTGNFSFINISFDVEIDKINEYQFPIIQIILIAEDLANPDNVIIRRSNTIRINDKILTNNSIYETDMFPFIMDQIEESGKKV